MEYMLYKHAEEGDTPASSPADAAGGDGTQVNKKRLVQALGAVGGGTLGYLLTRYGMGLKGAAAGITGAGIGSMAGLAGGSILADAATQEIARKEDFEKAIKENKAMVDENILQTLWRKVKNPWIPATGGATGAAIGYRGLRPGALGQRMSSELVQEAVNDYLAAPAQARATGRQIGDIVQDLQARWANRLTPEMVGQVDRQVRATRGMNAFSRRLVNEGLENLRTAPLDVAAWERLVRARKISRAVRGAMGGSAAAPILLALYDRTVHRPKRIEWLKEQGVPVT